MTKVRDKSQAVSGDTITYDVEAVLARVASVAGVTRDIDVARILGVRKQALPTWRQRGTVPYDRLMVFAQERGVSLDYLLLGRRPEGIDTSVFAKVLTALMAENSEQRMLNARDFGYFAALVYNRVHAIPDPARRTAEIARSVDLLNKVRAALSLQNWLRAIETEKAKGTSKEYLDAIGGFSAQMVENLRESSGGLEEKLPGEVFGPGTELEAAFLEGRLDPGAETERSSEGGEP
jgi:hypothetical protein